MAITVLHPEDIRAVLRKRHGTVGAFAASRGLKPQQLADWLRGRTSAAVADAIADELGFDGVQLGDGQSMNVDDTAKRDGSHRLFAGAR